MGKLEDLITKKIEDAVAAAFEKSSRETQELKQELKEVRSNQDELINSLDDIKNKTNNLSIKTDHMLGSLSYLADEYDEFNSKILDSTKTAKKQLSDISDLKMKLNRIESDQIQTASQLDKLEQYGRRENLEIHGIPYSSDENTNKIVKQVATKLKVNLDDSHISTSHRLAEVNRTESKDQHPPIIVRFSNRDKRNEIFRKRKVLRPISSSSHSNSLAKENKIEIHENLTSKRKLLLKEANKVKRNLNYQFLWTSQGKIFLRHSPKSRIIHVSSLSILSKLGHSIHSGGN